MKNRDGVSREHSCSERYDITGSVQVLCGASKGRRGTLFQELQKDDVLFIDSSHVLKIGEDVPFLYLEVLPTLNVGVVVHIHDVPFPYNIPYPPDLWVFGQEWPMLWNEAMVAQAFLSFNSSFRIILSTPLIRYFDEEFLRKLIPNHESIDQNPNTFSSLWLKRLF